MATEELRGLWLQKVNEARNKAGMAFMGLPTVARADREVVLAAVAQDGRALQFASDALRGDRDIVLAATTQSGFWALKGAGEALRSDKEIVLHAVTKEPTALEFAGDNMKQDSEVVSCAVKQQGRLLQHAADTLKSDKDIVLAAVREDPGALEFAAESLKTDQEFGLFINTVLRKGDHALEDADDVWSFGKENVLVAIRQDPTFFKHSASTLQQDVLFYKDMVLAAVLGDGLLLEMVPAELRGDRKVALAAVRSNSAALRFVGPPLTSTDSELLDAAAGLRSARTYSDSIPHGLEDYLKQDAAAVMEITLSTRSAPGKATPVASVVRKAMKAHESLRRARMFDPRCDPSGDFSNRDRFARHHQQRSKRTGGFLVQIEEPTRGQWGYELSASQKVDSKIADAEELKTFRIEVDPSCIEEAVHLLVEEVKKWTDMGCQFEMVTQIRRSRRGNYFIYDPQGVNDKSFSELGSTARARGRGVTVPVGQTSVGGSQLPVGGAAKVSGTPREGRSAGGTSRGGSSLGGTSRGRGRGTAYP